MDVGDEIGGYTLRRRVGTGGAGTVWLAQDGAGQNVAFKAIHPAFAASEAARDRLVREARTVNSVKSDCVAHVIDIEVDASQPFVVSEFIEGPTLAQVIQSGPISRAGVAALAHHLAEVIDAVHAAHIIHRDIKPSNIICSPSGPFLIDFGIAMADEDDHLTRTGLVSGTAGYTAPELMRAQPADTAVDWWAWCATLLSAATGRPPYGTGDMQAIIVNVVNGLPDTAGLSPRAVQALTAGLSVDREERPSPSLIVADLMADAGWAPGALDYVAVDWHALLYRGEKTERLQPGEVPVLDSADVAPAVSYAPDTVVVDEEVDFDEYEEEEYEGDEEPDPDGTQIYESEWSNDELAQTRPMPTGATPVVPRPRAIPAMQGVPTQIYQDPYQPNQPWLQAPMAGPGVYMQPNAGSWLPPAQTYIPKRPKTPWILGAVSMGVLAALPLMMGQTGGLVALFVLVIFTIPGAMWRWLEQRRIKHGGARTSDGVALLGMAPLLALRALAELVLGLGLGALIPYVVWLVYSPGVYGQIQWKRPLDWLTSMTPPVQWDQALVRADVNAVVWALLFLELFTLWLSPTTPSLRDGFSRVTMKMFRPVGLRIVLIFVGIAFIVGMWIATTGGYGPSH
ncbi:serine/threonine-protein kinase [Schaalia vaccimaxillae]|uniref:serine/threonine-protein kinase n=1 Tax=Schaalia vaccimaxillae TaxID=183916 RepID=UPI0003B4ED27|nr:serine/threonine-protein kinase [Schaalia vaccimaxillae]